MLRFFLLLALVLSSIQADSKNQNIKDIYQESYSYENVQKYDEAIKTLAPLYKQYPKGYTLNLRLAWLSYLSKNYTDSIKYYEIASNTKPYALDPKTGLIKIYLDTYSFDKAEIIAYEVLKIDYYNYFANLYIIKALIAQEKYAIAQELTTKMLLIYPTNILFLEQLSLVYKHEKSPYLQKLYKDILILDPNNVLARSNLK
ncbi:MAG: hypothetical protein Q9M32_00740 [Sulfurimonas sp.]|nr:hypothetical protein [Sulfurimonas sp.]MDQ7061010.1 hypothetical protein [Sulfurimonas sp.]